MKAMRLVLFVFACASLPAANATAQKPIDGWLTTADQAHLLEAQPPITWQERAGAGPVVEIDEAQTQQTIDGFGHALTGGSAQLLMGMSASSRHALLQDVFSASGAATSYIRISVGASDMNERVYTYDDLPAGETDPKLKHFSTAEEERFVIPALKEILAINPRIKIVASPWTAPSWMKTNDAPKGGSLRPEFYDAYARYWVLYLKSMRKHGVRVDALTVQNEPENPKNTPSMLMTADEEAAFIGKHLGPALRKAHLDTKIIVFDHNCDHPVYPETILKDESAERYVDGSGFHLYRGEISALSEVHDAFPAKNIYFTEQMVIPTAKDPFPIARSVARVLVGASNNWSRNVLLWNLAADPHNGPHTSDGGCPVCTGAITIDRDLSTKLVAYYVTAHASKFVPPGSVHLRSPGVTGAPAYSAFRTPSGQMVVIVANPASSAAHFALAFHGKFAEISLPAGAVETLRW